MEIPVEYEDFYGAKIDISHLIEEQTAKVRGACEKETAGAAYSDVVEGTDGLWALIREYSYDHFRLYLSDSIALGKIENSLSDWGYLYNSKPVSEGGEGNYVAYTYRTSYAFGHNRHYHGDDELDEFFFGHQWAKAIYLGFKCLDETNGLVNERAEPE